MSNESTKISHFSDSELIEMYKKTSDKSYIGELYKRYTHLVYGTCLYYLKDEDEAKDSVINIFEKLFVELKKHEVNSFKGWLTFVVRNYCFDLLRKTETRNNVYTEYALEEKYNDIADAEDATEVEIKLENLEKAMKELVPFQRKCIELFYLEDLSYAQIVAKTGLTANEVKSYLQNGKRNLKLLLVNTK
jgi:RNA polymerase sigma-70 factor (ECF subfamily)